MQLLGIALTRAMFPFLTGERLLSLDRLEILFEAPDARPSTHHALTFYRGQRLADLDPSCRDNVATVRCVGDAAWPGYYHGVHDLHPELPEVDGRIDLGVLAFPPAVCRLCNVYVLLGYKAIPRGGKCLTQPRPVPATARRNVGSKER